MKVDKKDMKVDKTIEKMHVKLFNSSTQTDFAEQLARGKGHFRNLFQQIPIASYGLGQSVSNNTLQYRLKFKYFVAGDEMFPWFITDHFNAEILCAASLNSNAKITGKVFLLQAVKDCRKKYKEIAAL